MKGDDSHSASSFGASWSILRTQLFHEPTSLRMENSGRHLELPGKQGWLTPISAYCGTYRALIYFVLIPLDKNRK